MQADVRCVPYDPSWSLAFEGEAARIKEALGGCLLQLHHVGSTAIPGLCAKPRLDIITEVQGDPRCCVAPLKALGYAFRGEHNIPFKYGFRMRHPIEVNLALFPVGHPEVELNLLFRDILRKDDLLRQAYASLKLDEAQGGGVREVGHLFCRYTRNKDGFIRSVLSEAGFSRLRVLRCEHPAEWGAFGGLVRQHPACPLWARGDVRTGEEGVALAPLAAQLGLVCWVLCQGVQVVGAACFRPKAGSLPELCLSVGEVDSRVGVESYFRRFIQTWLGRDTSDASGLSASLGVLFGGC